MSPQICNRKICHQKYAMLRNVTKGGGDTFKVFFVQLSLSRLQIFQIIVVTETQISTLAILKDQYSILNSVRLEKPMFRKV